VTKAETSGKVSTELTSTPATNVTGADLENPQGFVLAGAGFETHGPDQGLKMYDSKICGFSRTTFVSVTSSQWITSLNDGQSSTLAVTEFQSLWKRSMTWKLTRKAEK